MATGQALDREMAARIARHRATRSADWMTAEVPCELAAWFRSDGKAYRTIVVDCLDPLVEQCVRASYRRADVAERVDDVLEAIRAVPAKVVLVSNELGFGLVPINRERARFPRCRRASQSADRRGSRRGLCGHQRPIAQTQMKWEKLDEA